jgi:hypothetical protein
MLTVVRWFERRRVKTMLCRVDSFGRYRSAPPRSPVRFACKPSSRAGPGPHRERRRLSAETHQRRREPPRCFRSRSACCGRSPTPQPRTRIGAAHRDAVNQCLQLIESHALEEADIDALPTALADDVAGKALAVALDHVAPHEPETHQQASGHSRATDPPLSQRGAAAAAGDAATSPSATE